jgi:hypothetical protein
VKQEKYAYDKARRLFQKSKTSEERLNRLRDVYPNDIRFAIAQIMLDSVLVPDQEDDFMSFEEYSRHRESNSHALKDAYETLLKVPHKEQIRIVATDPVEELRNVELNGRNKWQKLQIRWVLQLYREELKEQWGGFNLIDEQFLPLGVLTMMRRQSVRWTMVV